MNVSDLGGDEGQLVEHYNCRDCHNANENEN